jgi:hypothetical protein
MAYLLVRVDNLVDITGKPLSTYTYNGIDITHGVIAFVFSLEYLILQISDFSLVLGNLSVIEVDVGLLLIEQLAFDCD